MRLRDKIKNVSHDEIVSTSTDRVPSTVGEGTGDWPRQFKDDDAGVLYPTFRGTLGDNREARDGRLDRWFSKNVLACRGIVVNQIFTSRRVILYAVNRAFLTR